MVFVQPPVTPASASPISAFLTVDISDQELATIKSAFEVGAASKLDPRVEIKIVKVPAYVGKSHSFIRAKENEADRTDGFVVIDEDATKRGGIWWVAQFATEEEVEEELAVSTSVLWKILVKPDCLAMTWVNYDIGNMDIIEDLDGCEVELPPAEDFYQPRVWDCGGLDMEAEQGSLSAYLVAEPEEYEESSDPEHTGVMLPRPDKVARLKEGLAEAIGFVNGWHIPEEITEIEFPDGSTRKLPEGTVRLYLNYDPNFDWPPYQWPEGSL